MYLGNEEKQFSYPLIASKLHFISRKERKKDVGIFAQSKTLPYICTAFEKARVLGSVGEWLKPPVC